MQRYAFLATVLIAFFLVSGQAQHSFYLEEAPEVTGQLTGYDAATDGPVTITYSIVVPGPEFQQEKTTEVAADGSFSLDIPYPLRRQQVWITVAGYYFGQILLADGLEIAFDLNKLRKRGDEFGSPHVTFSGPDGRLTTYMNQWITYEISKRKHRGLKMEVFMDREASGEEKWARLQPMYEHQAEVATQFITDHPSPYAELIRNELTSSMYGDALVVFRKDMPPALWEDILQHQPLLWSNDGASFLRSLAFNRRRQKPAEELAAMEQYLPLDTDNTEEGQRLRRFIRLLRADLNGAAVDQDQLKEERKYVYKQYEKELFQGKVDQFSSKITVLPSAEMRDLTRMIGGEEDIWKQDIYVERVLPTMETEWLKQYLQDRWAETRAQMQEVQERLAAIKVPTVATPLGTPAGNMQNGARLIEAAPMSIDSLLAGIRHEVGNKAIIFDIWATWCGPCLYDMKDATGNIGKLREKDIEVVYICVADGATVKKWKQKVAEFDLPTLHLFLTPEQSQAIMEQFNLRGYPSHLFLDEDGQYHDDVLHSISRLDWEKLEEFGY
mgnify:CR=1 FL=1